MREVSEEEAKQLKDFWGVCFTWKNDTLPQNLGFEDWEKMREEDMHFYPDDVLSILGRTIIVADNLIFNGIIGGNCLLPPKIARTGRSKHTMVAYNNALYVFGGDDGYVTKASGLRQRKIVRLVIH